MKETSVQGTHQSAGVYLSHDLLIHCEGLWTIQHAAALERALAVLSWPDAPEVILETGGIQAMDTAGAWLLQRTLTALERKGRQASVRGLRPEFAGLLKLVSTHGPAAKVTAVGTRPGWLERIGILAWERLRYFPRGLGFLGENTAAMARLIVAPRLIRWNALLGSLERDGFQALPITGLLSFLMGVVIAYQGAEQLRTFGANIFVVDLVGISLLREIAPLVTAILVAGRSGSAYAAEIGTMKVTEELDAIRTLGIAPLQLLVLPKILALVIAMPLLTVYADAIGVFGGMLIASAELDVSFAEFISRFEEAVALRHFVIGIGKAPVFAIIIALVGCYQGFQIRGGVDDVGRHTTISVVQSIFLVIVFDAFFSVVLSWWKV